jgi:LAS superfamily LD-carboxypeptidase LdcB
MMKKAVCMMIALLMLTGLAGCGNNSSDVKAAKGSSVTYRLIKEYLADNASSIEHMSKIEITTTNETENAVAGSAVTFNAVVTGRDKDSNEISEPYDNVTIAEDETGAAYTALTQNTVAIYDNTPDAKQIEIPVSFCGVEKTFTYNVVRQTVSAANLAMLVNNFTGTGSDYTPENLTVSDWIYYAHGTSASVSKLESEATDALEEMFEAAEADGITLWGCSGYRSYSMQQSLYNSAVASLGEDQNDTAKPGYSEHQTGLAMDITWPAANGGLYEGMESHAEYAWLVENSWKYGWVLRYPKGYEAITGYTFEPWHYRYIGKELAAAYHESGLPHAR